MSSSISQRGVPAPQTCPVSAESLEFLSKYALTQRFRVGQPSGFQIAPTGDRVYFLRTADAEQLTQNLYQLDVASGSEVLLMRAEDLVAQETMSDEERRLRERKRLTSKGILSFQLRPHSNTQILIPYQKDLYLLDTALMANGGAPIITNLTANSKFEAHGSPSYVTFSPDGNRISLVRNGDIYVVELNAPIVNGASSAPAADEFRLTFIGTSADPHSTCGVADFIAMEEIGRFKGMWWSPDSTHLLYQHTDTRALEELTIADLQQPQTEPARNPYPRPGMANSKVRFGVLKCTRSEQTFAQADVIMGENASNGSAATAPTANGGEASKKRKLEDGAALTGESSSSDAAMPSTPLADELPSTVWLEYDSEKYPYLCTVSWDTPSAPLTLVFQNRLQTLSSIMVVGDIANGACRELFQVNDERWASLDHSAPKWLADGRHFLWSSDQPTGFDTLYLYDATGKRLRPLHDSESVMYRKILQVNETRDVVYVLGGPNPTEQHIWQIPLGLKGNSAAVSLTSSPAVHQAVFSGESSLFVHESSNLTDGTRVYVRNLSLPGEREEDPAAGRILAVFSNVSKAVPEAHRPRVEIKVVKGSEQLAFDEERLSQQMIAADRASNTLTRALVNIVPKRSSLLDYTDSPVEKPQPQEITYYAAVLRPQGYDPKKKYPVVSYVYGGPGHRLVTHDCGTWFIAQFVANQGFIVVTADNRGTPCRGAAWEKAIKYDYRELPLRDQVTAIKALAAQDPSMDLSRGVGVYGWSYGGYMSALAVMCYPSLFTAGFVGAPVCDWRDYDTNYTERVLGLPLEHEADYDRSSVLTYAKDLLRPMMLVHGLADDNVFFMHALKMSSELFKHGREHIFLPLPGTHMLSDPMVTMNMYTRLVTFLKQHVHTD